MNSQNPGKIYKESGNLNFSKYVIYFFIGLVLSGLLGIGYGFVSHINPLIYLNFILLGVVIVISSVINGVILSAMHSRNSIATYTYLIIASFFVFYNAWASVIYFEQYDASMWSAFTFDLSISDIMHYSSNQNMSVGRFGRGGVNISDFLGIFYLIEALILFIAPIYIVSKASFYYCEKCMKNFTCVEFYFTKNNFTEFHNLNSGNLPELEEEQLIPEGNINLLSAGTGLINVNYCTCESCNTAIVDLEMGMLKAGDKKEMEFESTKELTKGMYLDPKTSAIIKSKLG